MLQVVRYPLFESATVDLEDNVDVVVVVDVENNVDLVVVVDLVVAQQRVRGLPKE